MGEILMLGRRGENLACDEVLLQMAEESPETGEVLRVWEPVQYFVVIGYANRAASEVNLEYCETNTIPVLRRCTGGGAVLQGPGCLNYSLILPINASIHNTNASIMQRHAHALGAEVRGHSDLTRGDRKFSGNAQRRKRRYLLFHGSFLLDLDIALVERLLPMPSRQPDYRHN